ncbi:MAG TPA: MBL fold metallo-hydrolase [Gemmatimonadaceae bacterium]|nr:MBL fold metallo-hydrolase [Gemmatimonadaceae bacterium]
MMEPRTSKEEYARSQPPSGLVRPARVRGRFRNPWPGAEPATYLDFLRWQVGRRVRQEVVRGPAWPRPSVAAPAFATPRAATERLLATWVGHSTVLLQIGGANVLTDPIWANRASPLGFAGPRRMVRPGVELNSLPPIDLVAISHNHYDHLDEQTVRLLSSRHPEARWIVPLGLGPFVTRLGARNAREMDWWEERDVGAVRVGCTPAQHHSARGLGDRGRSLWCGWTFAAGGRRVFFAGDTGHHPEFAAIGARFGPFDLTMIPIGAYEPRWFMRSVHMNPEEAVQAHLAASPPGTPMLAIHWGTFRLTDEPPGEPPVRAARAWAAADLAPETLWVLGHGETRERLPVG